MGRRARRALPGGGGCRSSDRGSPRRGWVGHDPNELWRNVQTVVVDALEKANLSASDLSALGIANQRETTVLWDRRTGTPVRNAINWEDTRTDRLCRALVEEFGYE